MRHKEMTRIRRELGLDLVEAARKAGVTGSSEPPRRMTPSAHDGEADDSLDLHFMDFEKFEAWPDVS